MIFGTIVFLMAGCFLFFGVFVGLSAIDDVFKDIERLYAHRVLAGVIGSIFLSIGYISVKLLIKNSTKDEVFIVERRGGHTSIAISAIEDVIKLRLKKYSNVKKYRIKPNVKNKTLNVSVNLVITSLKPSANVIDEIQTDLLNKIKNLIGSDSVELNISVKVVKVLDSIKV